MALYDCGASSVLIISNTAGPFPSTFYINGHGGMIGPAVAYNFPCIGALEITKSMGSPVTFKVVPAVSSVVDYSPPFSFLAGLLVALCFVIISVKRW